MSKYLVIGDALLDKYYFGLVNRQSPEDMDVPIVDLVAEEIRLGGALNVCANIRALSRKNDEVYVSSVISNFTAEILKKKNINYDSIVLDSTNLTDVNPRELVKTRILNVETHKQFLRVDNKLKFDESDIQIYKNKCFYFNSQGFDAIIVSDYGKGVIDKYIIDKLKQAECPIFVDTKNPDISLWSSISENIIFKLNSSEFNKLKDSHKSLFTIIVTRGEMPTEVWHKNNIIFDCPVTKVPNADVVGAGDIYLSAFVVKFCECNKKKTLFEKIEEAVPYANKAAECSVRKVGTCEVTRDEIVRLLTKEELGC